MHAGGHVNKFLASPQGQAVFWVVPDVTDEALSAARKEMARQGGEARAKALDPRKRKQIARKAAHARWKKKKL